VKNTSNELLVKNTSKSEQHKKGKKGKWNAATTTTAMAI
jgi:hypothetical protein